MARERSMSRMSSDSFSSKMKISGLRFLIMTSDLWQYLMIEMRKAAMPAASYSLI